MPALRRGTLSCSARVVKPRSPVRGFSGTDAGEPILREVWPRPGGSAGRNLTHVGLRRWAGPPAGPIAATHVQGSSHASLGSGSRLSFGPLAGVRPRRDRDVSSAGVAGRHGDADPGRQCGRCHRGGRHGVDRRRADRLRHRQRRLRDPLGRVRPARAQLFGPGAGRVDAAALRRPDRDAGNRLGRRDRAGCRRGLGRTAAPLRPIQPARGRGAGDPLRPRGFCGDADRGRAMAGGCRGPRRPAGLRGVLPAAGASAAGRRAVLLRGAGPHAGADRRHARRGVLSRRTGRGHRGERGPKRRRDVAGRSRPAQRRLGRNALAALCGRRHARTAAERAGDRDADRARHPRGARAGPRRGRRPRHRAPGHRGHQAGAARHRRISRRPRRHDDLARKPSRPRLSRGAGAAHRPAARWRSGSWAAGSRRDRVPVGGGPERDDDLVHPIELHGFRVGDRRAGYRHQLAEPGGGLQSATRPRQRGRTRQAAVPHHQFRASSRPRTARP